jgi:hypothetical protein
MPSVFTSTVVAKDAETVWALLRPFDALPAWANPALKVVIINGKSPTEVGAVRSITAADGGVFIETLVQISDRERSYSYVIDQSPLIVSSYFATVTVREVTDTGASFVTWQATFDSPNAEAGAAAQAFVKNQVFAPSLAHLKAKFGGAGL